MKKPSKHLIIGNWKMNPKTGKEAKTLGTAFKNTALKLKKTEVAICPPYPFMNLIKSGKNFNLGVQDLFFMESGSFTGEIGLSIAKDFGVKYAIIGHSERRMLGETNEMVAEKTKGALSAGITPIVCIGESKRDQAGEYLAFLEDQIKKSLQGVKKTDVENLIIAYEPVFTIGASFKDALKPHDIHTMVLYIRKVLAGIFGQNYINGVKVLYGGSVSAESAAEMIGEGEADGLLVGRQSLDKENFKILLQKTDAVPLKKY